MSRFFKRAGDSDDSDSETEESSEEELLSSDEEVAPVKAPVEKPKGMARFLKGAAHSSSSSSESESEEESDEDEEDDEGRPRRMNAFLVGEGGSDSDEDVKRVVKSASAKRMDEMEGVGKNIENALKINDWVAISNGKLYAFSRIFYVWRSHHHRIRQTRAHGRAPAQRIRKSSKFLYQNYREPRTVSEQCSR